MFEMVHKKITTVLGFQIVKLLKDADFNFTSATNDTSTAMIDAENVLAFEQIL